MKTKFTPGPWTCDVEPEDADGLPYATIGKNTGRGYKHGERFSISGVCSADDAALIAAAPELYNDLEMILDMLEAQGLTNSIQYRQARAALATARGEIPAC